MEPKLSKGLHITHRISLALQDSLEDVGNISEVESVVEFRRNRQLFLLDNGVDLNGGVYHSL